MFLRYYSLIIILFLSFSALAQKMIVYDEQQDHSIEFKYNSYESDNSLPNYFINKLSKSQSRMRSYFKYSISVNSHNKLIKNNNKYSVSIELEKPIIKGDFNYKGFNFKKACLPQKLIYSYNIFENNSNEAFYRSIIIDIYGIKAISFDSNFTDLTSLASYTISNEKLEYSFNENQKNDFKKSIGFINNYYSDGEKVKNVNAEIKKLDAENIDKLQLQSIDIKYIKKRFDKIAISKYKNQLSLEDTDPANIYHNYLSTKTKVDSLYQLFRHRLNILDSLFYAKGMAYKLDSNLSKAVEYFNKSIDFSPEYVPSLYQISLFEYNRGKYFESENYIEKILQITNTNSETNLLAKHNYEAMLKAGVELNNEERYTEGLQMLEHAKKFCTKNIDVIFCDSIQEPAIMQAKLGIYSSYISIAGASMRRGRFDMTENYLISASKYQKKYPRAIKTNKEAKRLYSLLITQYLRLSIESASKYQTKKADYYLAHADSIAKAESITEVYSFVDKTRTKINNKDYTHSIAQSDAIKHNTMISDKEYSNVEFEEISPEQIAINSYKSHYKKGYMYFMYWNFSRAYPEFKEALAISKKFNIKPDDSLFVYTQRSAKHLIIKELDRASLQAWASRFRTAENILNNAIKEIEANKLQNDKEIISKLEAAKAEIKNKEFSQQSKAFTKLMQRASQSLDMKDYLSMNLYCDTAIIIAKRSKQVPLNIEYPIGLQKKYNNEIKYQLLVNTTKTLCNNNKLEKSISTYKNSVSAFKNIKYKLDKFSLKDFAKYANSSIIYNYTIQQASEENKAEHALEIWNNAINNNITIDSKSAEYCMKQLGIKDAKSYPNSNKKALYKSRFGDSKEFKKYKKYYYRSINNKK